MQQIENSQKYEIRLQEGEGSDQNNFLVDPMPIGRQVLELFGHTPSEEYILLNLQPDGDLIDVGLSEVIDLRANGTERFFAFRSERTFNVLINSRRYPWGNSHIKSETLRFLGKVPDGDELVLERRGKPDLVLDATSVIDLSEAGLERIYSRKQEWKLNVQGVVINSLTPTISVRDAMTKAGIDQTKDWIAILQVNGEQPGEISLSGIIDLSKPGVEKLRFRPKEINNGEGPVGPRRDFKLLPKDEDYLNRRSLLWETIIENERRWLIIRSFTLPVGYNYQTVDIASDIPTSYPAAEIDMFYCYPAVMTINNIEPPTTTVRVQIEGKQYQRWSRHLNGATKWNIDSDSVVTHIAVIDECILREVSAA